MQCSRLIWCQISLTVAIWKQQSIFVEKYFVRYSWRYICFFSVLVCYSIMYKGGNVVTLSVHLSSRGRGSLPQMHHDSQEGDPPLSTQKDQVGRRTISQKDWSGRSPGLVSCGHLPFHPSPSHEQALDPYRQRSCRGTPPRLKPGMVTPPPGQEK